MPPIGNESYLFRGDCSSVGIHSQLWDSPQGPETRQVSHRQRQLDKAVVDMCSFAFLDCFVDLIVLFVLLFYSLLITSEGHIKLTDFGLSKIGLTNCKRKTNKLTNIPYSGRWTHMYSNTVVVYHCLF